jgi:hypothetical protein
MVSKCFEMLVHQEFADAPTTGSANWRERGRVEAVETVVDQGFAKEALFRDGSGGVEGAPNDAKWIQVGLNPLLRLTGKKTSSRP